MKHTITLLIALAIGAAAAFANFLYLNHKTKIEYFTAVRIAAEAVVEPGELIGDEHLEPIEILVSDDNYPSYTFLPYSKKGLILNRRAPRKLNPHDLLLKSDIVKEKGPPPEYENLGPFEVIAVGGQFIQSVDTSQGGGGDILTLAVDEQLDEKTRRLIAILDPLSPKTDTSDDGFRIVGVFMYPREDKPEITTTTKRPVSYTHLTLPTICSV